MLERPRLNGRENPPGIDIVHKRKRFWGRRENQTPSERRKENRGEREKGEAGLYLCANAYQAAGKERPLLILKEKKKGEKKKKGISRILRKGLRTELTKGHMSNLYRPERGVGFYDKSCFLPKRTSGSYH